MTFNPRFSSFRSRIAVLAVALWVLAFSALNGHRIPVAAIVLVAVAASLASAIPESPGKVKAENYPLTGSKP